MKKATHHLSRVDRTLARLIKQVGPMRLEVKHLQSPYQALVESVVYQQLSGKAAATILGRVIALFPKGRFPRPAQLLAMPDERLRAAGLSWAKIAAVKDIAQKTIDGVVPTSKTIIKLSNEEIVERLTVIRGVGRWTVEMLLIFKLGRADVLPVTDYGVRKGFARTFKRRSLPSPVELEEYGEKWKPFRTAAAWYLWRALEL